MEFARSQSRSSSRSECLKEMISQDNSSLIVDYLPEPYEPVIVHCVDFQCLAYLDSSKIWRNRFTNTPVDGRVVAWSVV